MNSTSIEGYLTDDSQRPFASVTPATAETSEDNLDKFYFTVDYAALEAIGRAELPATRRLKLMVAYIIVTSGKSTRKDGQTIWGANAVSDRTGWHWDTCRRLIQQLESIESEGAPILDVLSRKGTTIVRIPSQIDNVIIPRTLMHGHEGIEAPIVRILNNPNRDNNKQKCADLVMLISLYQDFDESLACCPGIVEEYLQADPDLSYEPIKGTLAGKENEIRPDFAVPGLSKKQMTDSLQVLFEMGLVRNIYINQVDGMSRAAIRCTSKYHHDLFGDYQKAIRDQEYELSYLGFNFRKDQGSGTPIHWLTGRVMHSIIPRFLYITSRLRGTIDRFNAYMQEDMEELEDLVEMEEE